MNIDKDRILFTSPASGGKESGDVGAEALAHVGEYAAEVFFASAQQWKLTIYDEARAGFGADLNAESEGNCIAGETIKIDYLGAQTGTDEYISAMIVDEEGNVLYYGNLVNNNEEGVTEGTAELRLPAELPVLPHPVNAVTTIAAATTAAKTLFFMHYLFLSGIFLFFDYVFRSF